MDEHRSESDVPEWERTFLDIHNTVLPEAVKCLVAELQPSWIAIGGEAGRCSWGWSTQLELLAGVPPDRYQEAQKKCWKALRNLTEPKEILVLEEDGRNGPLTPGDSFEFRNSGAYRVIYADPGAACSFEWPTEAQIIVQIDIDGTLDAAPEFFRWMSGSLRRYGHRVLIVSSRVESPECREATLTELKTWGIDFDELLLTPEELKPEKNLEGLHPGHRMYAYKVLAAREHGTTILFDDCGITAELFKKYLPEVKVFRPQAPAWNP